MHHMIRAIRGQRQSLRLLLIAEHLVKGLLCDLLTLSAATESKQDAKCISWTHSRLFHQTS